MHLGTRCLRYSAILEALDLGYGNLHRRGCVNGLPDAARTDMKIIVGAFLSGSLFGLGLALSEMINPARVVGFLDIAGAWDPTLLLVMGGALMVAMPVFPLVLRRASPVLSEQFRLPTKIGIDPPLIAGAAVFGAGWGLAGFCPGPALAAMVTASPTVALFVFTMLCGQWLTAKLQK